jgi:hypothetical protein
MNRLQRELTYPLIGAAVGFAVVAGLARCTPEPASAVYDAPPMAVNIADPLPPQLHVTVQGCPIWVPGKRHKPVCADPAQAFVPIPSRDVATRSTEIPDAPELPAFVQPDVQTAHPVYTPPVQANIPVYVQVHVDHVATPGTWPAGHRCYHETTAPCAD